MCKYLLKISNWIILLLWIYVYLAYFVYKLAQMLKNGFSSEDKLEHWKKNCLVLNETMLLHLSTYSAWIFLKKKKNVIQIKIPASDFMNFSY